MKSYVKCLILSSILVLSSTVISLQLNDDLFSRQGDDWPHTCKTGLKQSPINIVHGLNTKDSNNAIKIEYVLNTNDQKKYFCYDGSRFTLEVDLGKTYFLNEKGAEEIFKAERIELKLPSEHWVTERSRTPRYAVEMQIYHTLIKSSNPKITNSKGDINFMIISIFYDVHDVLEDPFFDLMGINGK
jgi:hypothetical protein